MAPLQRSLLGVVLQIFEAGTMTPSLCISLATIQPASAFSKAEREQVFHAFVAATWPNTVCETELTAEDWARLAMILRALELPVQHAFPKGDVSLAS